MNTLLEIEAEESDYLYTKSSQIMHAGMGLFTAIPIYKDEIICRFKGEKIDYEESLRRTNKGLNSYFLDLPDGRTLDTNNTKCFAGFANDAEGISSSPFKNNAEIRMDENDNVCLAAIKKITSGEEIFCAYGKRYWAHRK